MSFTVTVALVGDPTNPIAPPYEEFFEREWARRYADREKIDLEVEENETLGEVMTRAAAAWNVEVPEDWAGPVAFIGFYIPEDEERFHGWQSSITLVDEWGRAIWNNYWKDVKYGDLLRAADAGVVEGDPLRPYLILHAEIGNGLLADWGTVLNLWDLAWHVFDRVDTLMGVGAAALAARQLARRLKDRVSRGRSVVSEHYGDWRQRQGDPATLALFLSRTPRTTSEVAGLLGCAEPEAEAVLWAFGLARDENSGLWYPAAEEEAKLLQGNLELIIHAYDEGDLATRFHDRLTRLIETGEAPPVVWPGEREDDSAPPDEAGRDADP